MVLQRHGALSVELSLRPVIVLMTRTFHGVGEAMI